MSGPLLADANGDGKQDVIVINATGTGGARLVAYSGPDGSELWESPGWSESTPCLARSSRSGDMVAVGARHPGLLSAIDLRNGADRWLISPAAYWGSFICADLDRDGIDEVLVGYGDDPSGASGGIIALNSKSGAEVWRWKSALGWALPDAAGDLTGDGMTQVVAVIPRRQSGSISRIVVLAGHSGEEVWGLDFPGLDLSGASAIVESNAVGRPGRLLISASLAGGSYDVRRVMAVHGDGSGVVWEKDFVGAYASVAYLREPVHGTTSVFFAGHSLDLEDGSTEWEIPAPQAPPRMYSFADIDHDSVIDVVFWDAGYVACVSGATRKYLWLFYGGSYQGKPLAWGDTDGDGEAELAVVVGNNRLWVLDGAPLTALAHADPTEGDRPLTTRIWIEATGGVPPYSADWSFGDGSFGSGMYVEHTFRREGAHIAIATIRDASGRTTVVHANVSVHAVPFSSAEGTWVVGSSLVLLAAGIALTSLMRARMGPWSTHSQTKLTDFSEKGRRHGR